MDNVNNNKVCCGLRCKYDNNNETEYPCHFCTYNPNKLSEFIHKVMYEPKKDKEI